MWQTSGSEETREQVAERNALEFAPGTLIGLQYRIDRKLGGGGMGVVYKCQDLAMDRTVAIKFLQPHLASTHRGLIRLQQEARALSKLTDASIVKVHHFSRSSETAPPYLVMDFLEGKSLAEIIEAERCIELDRCLRIMIQVADGLAHAHRLGIVHRDLKPANIMLVVENGRETAKILDFGMAKILYSMDQMDEHLTRTGEVFGTPAYMSPEQTLGKTVDDRTDQYSLGCMLFECLAGTTPHVGTTAMETMIRHVTHDVDPLSQASLGKKFPARVETLVHRLLSKDPSKRYLSMEEVRDELFRALNKTPECSDTRVLAGTVVPGKHSKAMKIIVLSTGLLMVCAVGIGFLSVQQSREQAKHAAAEQVLHSQPATPYPVTLKMVIRGQLHEAPDPTDPYFADAASSMLRYTADHMYAEKVALKRGRFAYLTDQGLAAIQRMPNVRDVELTRCEYIGDQGIKHLLKFNLRSLDVSFTSVTDGVLAILRPMKSLESLSFVDDGAITNAGMKELQYFPHLWCLNLDRTSVNSQGLADIAKCKSLKVIKLNHLNVAGGLSELQALPVLGILDLSSCDIHDQDLKALVPMSRLRNLSLKSAQITEKGLETLKRMKQLKHMSVFNVSGINKAQIDDLQKALPNCHVRCDEDDPE